MARSSFLNTPEDMEWLRETHLTRAGSIAHRWRITNTEGDSQKDGPYCGDFTEFVAAILYGNEDSPTRVDLYAPRADGSDPQYLDPFVRWEA